MSCAYAQDVLVVSGNHQLIYKSLERNLFHAVEARGLSAEIVPVKHTTLEQLEGHRLIITLGAHAARKVSEHGAAVPMIHALLPQNELDAIWPAGLPKSSVALLLDQPEQRQIDAILIALPEWRNIALLYTDQSRYQAIRLSDAARRSNLRVHAVHLDSARGLYSAMQAILGQAILVALPDTVLFNRHTMQNIFLTSYHYGSPVMGFSSGYARAGALLSLYSTPKQISKQLIGLMNAVLDGRDMSGEIYPNDFEISVNHAVARSLNIFMPSGEIIRLAVKEKEGTK